MKKAQEVLGLPVISISDGIEAGKVKSIIVNADKGAVDYIVVDSGMQFISSRVVPTDKVLGIGEYALTIDKQEDIQDINEVPAAIDLLQKNIQVKGTKVLTKKGRMIGEISEICIDENDCCNIIGLEYIADITQKKIRFIPRESVITFGKSLVVVIEDVEGTMVDSLSQLDPETNTEKKTLTQSDSSAISFDDASAPDAPSDSGTSAAGLFEQKQRQYIIGRNATKTITDNYGNIIISEGMTITDEIIDNAKLNGKLIELMMNNKA